MICCLYSSSTPIEKIPRLFYSFCQVFSIFLIIVDIEACAHSSINIKALHQWSCAMVASSHCNSKLVKVRSNIMRMNITNIEAEYRQSLSTAVHCNAIDSCKSIRSYLGQVLAMRMQFCTSYLF